MSTRSLKARPAVAATLACCAFAFATIHCGFGGSGGGSPGTGGSTTTGTGTPGTGGTPSGTGGTPSGTGGTPSGTGGSPSGTGGSPSGTGGSPSGTGGVATGTGGAAGSPAGTGGGGGTPVTGTGGSNVTGTWLNYEVTASFPKAPVAVAQKAGTLKYTKVVIHNQFLAESCSIGDYNGDGTPDISSGRIWYQGPDFKTQHPFRDGHGVLPSAGAAPELNTGVSDDWADYPWDMDGDGDTDIINIAQCDVPEDHSGTLTGTGGPQSATAAGTPNKIGIVQVHATAYWYENPGKAGLAGDPKWTPHLMHSDIRMEQHEIVDMNGDGYPEVLGACRDCPVPVIAPAGNTKGYYQGDPKNPTAMWTYHQVSAHFTFPFGNLGWMHGIGAGDINGDGKPDWMDRYGAYLQQPGGTWNLTPCTGKDTPAGCGFIQNGTALLPQGFSPLGIKDTVGNIGPSHMFAVDMDKDGCTDVVAADWAHGHDIWLYLQQGAPNCNYSFKAYKWLGDSMKDKASDVALYGAGFTEPHAFNVYDMDNDGRPDVIAGKMRFAHPYSQNDPDPDGTPYLYVFKNVATPDPNIPGLPITLKPMLVDGDPTMASGTVGAGLGIGRQFAVGHVNTDGIIDICVATKVGLAVYLGQ
jgi:hypothetical protein